MSEDSTVVPPLPTLHSVGDALGLAGESRATILIAEGLPPIQTKLLEKIRRWEFVDLALLLHDSTSRSDEFLLQQRGERVVLVQSVEQAQRRRRQIGDILSWTKAFSIYGAALSSDEGTSKEEIVGLWAHMHLVNQLSRDLNGNRWLAYDSEFREWAAAKGVRRWGELNLTIYGKCLSDGLVSSMSQVSQQAIPTIRSVGSKRSVTKDKVCFPWNFDHEGCNRRNCSFLHSCYHCSGHHRARDCKASGSRSKKGRMGESPGDLPLN